MATYTSTYTNAMGVNASFQDLMGRIDSHIQSLGWTYTAQTGDGDPSATAAPSVGVYPVFRCYATNDGLTAWYMRVDFGRAASSNGPSLKVQVGTGVNGSGTLTGQTSTQITTDVPSGATGTAFNMSGDGGRMGIFIGTLTSSSTFWGVIVGRRVDGSGVGLGDGMEIFYVQQSTGGSQYVPASGTIPSFRTIYPAACGNSTTEVIGSSPGSVMTAHPVLWDATGANNPSPNAMLVGSSDFTDGTTTTVTIYGASHTYLVQNAAASGQTNKKVAVRFE